MKRYLILSLACLTISTAAIAAKKEKTSVSKKKTTTSFVQKLFGAKNLKNRLPAQESTVEVSPVVALERLRSADRMFGELLEKHGRDGLKKMIAESNSADLEELLFVKWSGKYRSLEEMNRDLFPIKLKLTEADQIRYLEMQKTVTGAQSYETAFNALKVLDQDIRNGKAALSPDLEISLVYETAGLVDIWLTFLSKIQNERNRLAPRSALESPAEQALSDQAQKVGRSTARFLNDKLGLKNWNLLSDMMDEVEAQKK